MMVGSSCSHGNCNTVKGGKRGLKASMMPAAANVIEATARINIATYFM